MGLSLKHQKVHPSEMRSKLASAAAASRGWRQPKPNWVQEYLPGSGILGILGIFGIPGSSGSLGIFGIPDPRDLRWRQGATTTTRKRPHPGSRHLTSACAARLEHLEVTCGISPPPPDDEPTVVCLNTSPRRSRVPDAEADGCDDSHEGVYTRLGAVPAESGGQQSTTLPEISGFPQQEGAVRG